MNRKLFVGGDLSGIQKFLYNISSKKAALSLRGRSAYLDKYMKDVCEELKKELSNAIAREVYNSGGKFYLIADDTQDNRGIVDKVAKERNKELWEEHYGQLSINIAYIPFEQTNDNGNREEIAKCFKGITQRFAEQKQKKFQNLLIEDYNNFFEVQQVPEKTKVCDVTGIESENLESIEDLNVLPSVKEQIQKGIELKSGEQLYMDFADYVKGSFLGVLRMDVDGLGSRFAQGFDSWDEYTKFSEDLAHFFDRDNLKQFYNKESIDLIYAGGDDIFAVGRWDDVLDFAYNVHLAVEKEFSKENIHISGGMIVVNPKFPISKAAEMSGEAEEKAKNHDKDGVVVKNAFTIFNETVSWEGDFEKIIEYKDKFIDLIENNNMSKSILHKIMYYYEIIKENDRKQKEKEDFSYLWHSSYYLTRFIERYKQNNKVVDFCTNLRDNVLIEKENYKILSIAARWTELLLRDKEKQK